MLGATGTLIAAESGGSGGQSAAKSEYKPGYGPCRNDGVNPSGTHTGPPGQENANCQTRPGTSGPAATQVAASQPACRTGSSFAIRVGGATKVKRAKVLVNGHEVRVRRGVARVAMPPGFSGPVLIKVKGRTKRGAKVVGRRIFNPCATRKNPTVSVRKKS